jgi:hypothetical protein
MCALLAIATAAPAAILEYKFNKETDATYLGMHSTGTDDAEIVFVNPSDSLSDMISAPGQGVGGDIFGHVDYQTDRALDNTSATGMGAGFNGGGAKHPAYEASIEKLASWTVSGWYKTDVGATIGGGGAVIFNALDNTAANGTSGGFAVRTGSGANAGRMRVTVNGFNAPELAGWDDENTWVFFAITYDGTESTDNLKYYRGYRNGGEAGTNPMEVTLLQTDTFNQGIVRDVDPTTGFAIANRDPTNLRPFDGLLDNIRVDGSHVDSTGALSLGQLESYRASDVFSTVPEPSSIALALLGAVGGLAFAGRRAWRKRLSGGQDYCRSEVG